MTAPLQEDVALLGRGFEVWRDLRVAEASAQPGNELGAGRAFLTQPLGQHHVGGEERPR
jgi:hypothetical protein